MSILAWAWTAVAVIVGACLIVFCVVLFNVVGVMAATKDLIDDVRKQTVPILGEVKGTVGMVNTELAHLDGIMVTAEGVTQSVGNLVTVVSSTLTSPLVKLSAFAFGLRKAVNKAAEEPAPARRRFRR